MKTSHILTIGALLLIVMGLFSLFTRGDSLKEENLPWYNRPSIYSFISSNLDSSGILNESADILPDDERLDDEHTLRLAPGGQEGIYIHHTERKKAEDALKKIASLLKVIARNGSLEKQVELYQFVRNSNVIEFIDPLIEDLAENEINVQPHLYEFAQWLAFEAPDRNPVKLGIALLGAMRDSNSVDKIFTLGKHEEFTLYTATAISNTLKNPYEKLWELAKCVDGWGRMSAVERLIGTQNPEIQQWLLRETHETWLFDYMAMSCAVAGDLKGALSKDEVDDELMLRAGNIIELLITSEMSADIFNYEDGPETIRHYIRHSQNSNELHQFIILHIIHDFLDNKEIRWELLEPLGWTKDIRSELLNQVEPILGDSKWTALILDQKETTDDEHFERVDKAAQFAQIDLWKTHWKRLQEHPVAPDRWATLMQHINRERIKQVIDFAVESLTLNEITTGETEVRPVTPSAMSNVDLCLTYIVQDIRDFPGYGLPLIEKALESTSRMHQDIAMRTLVVWGRENWPEETMEMLRRIQSSKQSDDVKELYRKLLAGEDLYERDAVHMEPGR